MREITPEDVKEGRKFYNINTGREVEVVEVEEIKSEHDSIQAVVFIDQDKKYRWSIGSFCPEHRRR